MYYHPIAFLCVVAIIGSIFGLVWFLTTDTAELIGEYLSAKKEGICPVIEFEEDNDNDRQ